MKKIPSRFIKTNFYLEVPPADIDLSRFRTLIVNICRQFKVPQAVINIRIVDDAGITDVHRQFLGLSTATDVISFDLSDDFEPGRTFELAVNLQMAARQAAQRGHSTEAELALYITHGLLHHLGFDDATPAQARNMHAMEDSILQKNGFGIVYSDVNFRIFY